MKNLAKIGVVFILVNPFLFGETVLVGTFFNGNNHFLHSRAYIWNPSQSDASITARLYTLPRSGPSQLLAAIIHKFGVSVDFLRKFRAESVFRCDYKASKLVEPNRDEARAPSGNSSARRGLYICVGAGSQGNVRWDTDGASVMRRAFVRDKTMPGAPRCDEKFPEPGHRF